ncbi:glucagon receptor isoform X2 [Sagmatias obliquidens]|uniref:glucagon receptor isoform X2 n=1 Tax=Sagmatias obliquidens TaxID=3371155 RepID=UPI000F43EEE9|nr:glucagon receptor isoform X2 [Lagenorhynchus obliquidens]
MPPILPRCPHLLLLLLLACQPQAPSAQVMDFLFEKWKLYGDQCLHNLSLLPPPTELVCNRTFDKYSCWPDTPPNTTANISCPWYLPWHHKVQHRLVFKRCGPDGQWVRGPRGQPWRNASQCQMDDKELEVQKEVAKMYSSFQVMYTVGYSLSLGALLLALAILLGLSKLHCTRNYIHVNLFASFVLKASSVLVIDTLLKTRYSQRIGDDFSVSVWLSDGVSSQIRPLGLRALGGRQLGGPHSCCPRGQAVAGCRVAAVFMQYGVVANYCWLLVEGVYLHSLLSFATIPERSCFPLYLGIGWGEWAGAQGAGGLARATGPQLFSPQVPPCCSSPPGWWSSVCLRTSSEYLTGGPAGGFASPGWEVLGWPRGEWPCGSECGSGSGVSGQRQWGALSKPGSPGVEVIGNYLPSFPEALIRSQGIRGWGATRLPGHKQAPPCRCWTSNDNMGFWWILRFPVFLAILINFFIFIRILHLLVAKLQAHQMRYTDYKFRWVWALGVGGRQAACGIPGARGSVGGGGGTRAPGGAGLVAQSLPPQAGQVHADPHPPVGGPRGGVCLCDRRACPGHPALRQALLRPLPQLLPGPAGGCSLLFPQQGGAVGVAAALASLA